jgi:hypothetical protein
MTQVCETPAITAETIMAGVRSYCPGRVRLRLECLKGMDEKSVEMISSFFAMQEGVTGAVINPRVGSLLLTWDTAKVTLEPEDLAQAAVEFLEAARGLGMFGETPAQEEGKAPEENGCGEDKVPEAGQGASACRPSCAAPQKKECACALPPAAFSLIEGVTGSADKVLELLSGILAPDVAKGARAKRVTQNCLMLGSLAASLASIAAGKNAHTVFGVGFLALLGVHLWQHRRVL